MSNTARQKRLYDNALRVSLNAPGYSGRMADSRIQQAAADHLGIAPDDLSGSKVLVPAHYLKAISQPVSVARFHLREIGVPWSSSKSDLKGNKKQGGDYLVYNGDFPKLEPIFRKCKSDREAAVRYFLDRYDDVIAAQRVSLGPLFREEDYLSRSELEERFSWTVEITPLWSMSNVEDDLRLKLPTSWAEEQVKVAKLEEAKRISNAVAAVANEVAMFMTGTEKKPGILTRLNDYDPSAMLKDCPACEGYDEPDCEKCDGTGKVTDKRVGNTFRDKTLYDSLPELRERISDLNNMLGDDALDATVNALSDVEKLLDGTTPEEIRNDEDTREDIAEALGQALESAAPVTDRIAELMR